ncbi:sugar transferase, PEP-CTERM/EpsH1 system associated [Nitrosomonas cryotolerans]|uniref:Sugar transferase, PEP-CTERM/EpsH1 system associated n=1 Tax=Nitrosomonas cryotolerans ATCC 49181 TaxID=1131553 RepID=A0A1N6J762_9PROT|nr:TIGR03088 family PEP-CTERM/XrtA system glycosyltransferase [Nitrosomonas cryotolerans]SFP45020.1 sugar transferase, PEP-CTERM/EpsH1 system associated [Nitrosomonas cryotolerans]SIO40174.1 sugar transferase, PEP-CTERM/EpsH1 system associated [Nitrosomonas cryotolerans ATCC 49181]
MITPQSPLILHVIHHLVIGGMENGLVNLVNKLPASCFRHAIVCIDHSSDFSQRIIRKDIKVYALNRSERGIWPVRRDLFGLCKALKPKIVHTRNLSGLDALLPARLAGVRYCLHSEHGRDVNDLKGDNQKLRLLRRLHNPLINQFITVSKDLQQYLINIGIRSEKITQVYNGVDTERFSPAMSKPQRLLPEFLLGSDKIIIGTVGRIQAVKDQHALLRAYQGLLAKYPDLGQKAYLVIVGNGPLLGDLKEKAISLGISHRVWFSGSLDTIPEILKTFDIFVLPSLAEGISNTVLEAMATGLPVITTNVGGNVELVTEGLNGRFFRPGNIEHLSELIAEYTADKALLKKHGHAARQAVLTHFSLAAMISGYQRIYEANC